MAYQYEAYPISWEGFLNPSDSYFLFADFVDFYTHLTYICICTFFVAFFSVTIQKHYPHYGIPIWCLWPNIRFQPSTVTEKNATKNILDGRKDGKTDRGKTVYPLPLRGAGVILSCVLLLFMLSYWTNSLYHCTYYGV
jgi:hypothetical protein